MILNPQLRISKISKYLKKREKPCLINGSLLFAAGIIVTIPGFVHLFNSLLIDGFALATFDKLMADTAASVLLILPALIVFSTGYLLLEAQSLGWKLSIATCLVAVLLGGFGFLSVELAFIIGVLSGLAAAMEIRYRKNRNDQKDSALITENVVKLGLALSGAICIVTLAGMIIYLAVRGSLFFSWNFFAGQDFGMTYAAKVISGKVPGGSLNSIGGFLPYALGSLLLAGLCELIALPIGIGGAIYLAEYAGKNRLTSTVRYFIETLAGIPSIVVALVGATVFVVLFQWGYCAWAAAISLSFMILPWNIRIAEEAIRSVPAAYREASFALGATKWQTTSKAVLFAASPGIITGVLLGFGEALGETIVIALTAGYVPISNLNEYGQPIIQGWTVLPSVAHLFSTHTTITTLPIFIWQAPKLLTFGTGASGTSLSFMQYGLALAAGFYLVMIYLVICAIALVARNYLRKRILGK